MERGRYGRMRAGCCAGWGGGGTTDNARNTYRDGTTRLVALRAALHGKPAGRATVAAHWPAGLRPRGRAGGPARVGRRARAGPARPVARESAAARAVRRRRGRRGRPTTLGLLERWQAAPRRQWRDTGVKLVDGRGLVVGGCGKDADAGSGSGSAAGTKARGYKLHWAVDHLSGAVDGWLAAPMHYPGAAGRPPPDRAPAAARPLRAGRQQLRPQRPLRAGRRRPRRAVGRPAPPRRGARGLGHCRHGDRRPRVQPRLRTPDGRRTAATAARPPVEQADGRLGRAAVGPDHLPYHARRLHRATVWVALEALILTDLQAGAWHRRCA